MPDRGADGARATSCGRDETGECHPRLVYDRAAKNEVRFTYLQPGLAGRAGFNLYKSLRETLLRPRLFSVGFASLQGEGRENGIGLRFRRPHGPPSSLRRAITFDPSPAAGFAR